ncbi:MAG: sortase [bacterium]|nr:sortase [bacterium]
MPKLPNLLIISGLILLAAASTILGLTFYSPLKEELSFATAPVSPNSQTIQPVDEEFGIVIPKIRANAKVIPGVDPYNEREYQIALSKGVAQAKGTALPGETGNIFIFAHSSANFFEANRYNSIFYLLHRLEAGDEIDLFYQKQKFTYVVTEKKLVDPSEVSYLNNKGSEPVITLMTCWPPGTTLKRLLVLGKLEQN